MTRSISLSTSRQSTVLVAILTVTALTVVPLGTVAQTDSDDEVSQVELQGQPSYIVKFEDGHENDLTTWAQDSDARHIIDVRDDGTAVVAAPVAAVRSPGWGDALLSGNFFGYVTTTGLTETSWIEWVSPNYQHSVNPVERLIDQSEYSKATPDGLDVMFRINHNPSEVNPEGIAFSSDANRTTMSQGRHYTGTDNVSVTGLGQTIAVIDTGVNTDDGRIFGNGSAGSSLRISDQSKDFVNNETVFSSDIDAVSDGNGHGTWVASSIAANHSNSAHDGVAPDSTILALKALADDGSGSSADISAAIRYAADHDADVISMSLGSPVWDKSIVEAIQYARDQGSLVVVAAGNSRQTTRWVGSPADAEGVVTVAAANGDDHADAEAAYFSQHGPDPGTTDNSMGKSADATIDVAAPGMETVAVTPSGNSTLSGTSMATPYVSAAAALYMDANPDATPTQAREWIRKSARPMPNAAKAEVGHGYLAVDNLVNEDAPGTDQSDAMTSEARARDQYYRALSDTSGGILSEIFG